MATFDPRRLLMFAVRVLEHGTNRSNRSSVGMLVSFGSAQRKQQAGTHGKRAWGFVICSGRNRLWLEVAPAGSQYGAVNLPGTPKRGNDVSVIGI